MYTCCLAVVLVLTQVGLVGFCLAGSGSPVAKGLSPSLTLLITLDVKIDEIKGTTKDEMRISELCFAFSSFHF